MNPVKLSGVAALLVAVFLVMSLAAASAGTDHRPAIVFVTATSATTSPDLAVRTGDGRITRLTRNRWHEGLPSWSPDRERIAFISARRGDTDIYVVDADGQGLRALAGGARRGSDELYPAWSPDGRLIVFSSYRNGRGQVYVVRADGTGSRRLTVAVDGVDNMQPRFSPNGRFVLFASTRAPSGVQLFRVRASDGGGVRQLTFAAPGNVMPDYSPDGKRIAFVSYRAGGGAIWTMDADGGGLREVARHRGLEVAFPRFSPDGRMLLYSTFEAGETVSNFRLRVVSIDGGGAREIGPGAEADW